jgi:predicted nucleotidyltransferase
MDLSHPYIAICPTLDGPVLEVLAHTSRPLTGRDVARLARRGSERGVLKVLHRLVEQGLVTSYEAGRSLLFALNRDHVAAPVVDAMLGLQVELFSRIRGELATWSIQPVHVSVFGSAARHDGSTESDIDLLILRADEVTDDDAIWRDQLQTLAEHVHGWSGNHASLVELSPKQLRAAVRRQEPIIDSLRASAVTLAGDEFSDLAGIKSSRRTA